jgi:hypothetical protein
MAIVTRAGKGSALTHDEMDTNLTDLRDGVNAMVPAQSGIKVNSLVTPVYGWMDLPGQLQVAVSGPTAPAHAAWLDGIDQLQFDVDDEINVAYTFPHDYAPNTDIYVYVSWSHNSALVTGGSLTWVFHRSYAKSYNQAAFATPKDLTFVSNASVTPLMLIEDSLQGFTPGGNATMFDTTQLESGGMIIGRLYLAANNLTVSAGQPPKPFLHRVGVHYRSRAVGTKNQSYPFWT